MIIDPQTNFWKNQQLKSIFKQEYSDNVPSDVMWGLYLIYHPSSEYYDTPLKIRIDLVKTDLFPQEYRDKDFTNTIQKIQSISLTKTQQSMFNWEKKLEERDDFIAKVPYNEDTFEMLDKLMSQTSKLWDQYFSIQKQLSKDSGTARGDEEESLSDKGLI